MSNFTNFNINGTDASINLASETKNGLMSIENYLKLTIVESELKNKLSLTNESPIIIKDNSKIFYFTDDIGNIITKIDYNGIQSIAFINKNGHRVDEKLDDIYETKKDSFIFSDSQGNVIVQIDKNGLSAADIIINMIISIMLSKQLIRFITNILYHLVTVYQKMGTIGLNRWQ